MPSEVQGAHFGFCIFPSDLVLRNIHGGLQQNTEVQSQVGEKRQISYLVSPETESCRYIKVTKVINHFVTGCNDLGKVAEHHRMIIHGAESASCIDKSNPGRHRIVRCKITEHIQAHAESGFYSFTLNSR